MSSFTLKFIRGSGVPIMADYTPSVAANPGDVVVVNGRPSVIHQAIDANKLGARAIGLGVYSGPAAGAMNAGDDVWWDATNLQFTKTQGGNTYFGFLTDDSTATNPGDIVNVFHYPANDLSGGEGGRIPEVNTNIATVGAGTLTAAAIAGGVITRSGSTAAYTDTTDTAVAIIAAQSGLAINESWELMIKNTVAFAQTLAAGVGVTLSGQTIIPPNSVGRFLVTKTAAATVSIQGLAIVPITTPPLIANTAITTVGAGTLTGAALAGGVITRSGSVAAYTDTTDTAANIIAALPNAQVGQSLIVAIKNTVAFPETIAAGAGVTLSGQTIIPPNSVGEFLLTYSAAGACTLQGLSVGPMTVPPLETNTTLTTVGAGTPLAASIVAGVLTRSGPTAAFTDTTDTAANVILALPNGNVGQSWEFTYINTTAFVATLAGGAGLTLTELAGGTLTVSPNSWARFLVTMNGLTTVTMQCIAQGPNNKLPGAKFSTINVTTGTLAAGNASGAGDVNLTSTNATPGNQAMRTPAQILTDTPGLAVGDSYTLLITQTGTNTFTLTTDSGAGFTMTGTMTIAQNTWRKFVVTINTPTTGTVQSVATGTFS